MTREDVRRLVDTTRGPGDELEIVRGPVVEHDDDLEIDAREGADAVVLEGTGEAGGEHPLPVSPEMIGLPPPSSDLLPRRRRFLLRTRPAVTEPHTEPHAEPHREPYVDASAAVEDDGPRASCDGDRPDLAGFRLPGTRAPDLAGSGRLTTRAAEPVVVEDAVSRPDRRARRRSRRARTLAVSSLGLVLLVVVAVLAGLALAVR